MKAETKRKAWSHAKLIGLEAGSFITLLAPLSVYVGVNWQDYFSTTAKAVSLTVGGGMAVGLAALAMLGKLGSVIKTNKALTVFAVVFVLCWALEPIIVNAKWLSGMLLIGQAGNAVVFEPAIRKNKAQQARAENVTLLAEALQRDTEISGRV